MNEHKMRADWLDALVACLLVAGYVAWLLGTVRTLGYARDEGFYFQAAQSYEHWFELFLEHPKAAMERTVVDRWWSINHEHPAFMKSLFALSHRYLYERHPIFAEAGTAYRFPGMVVSSLGLAVTYLWGRLTLGRGAGLVAALSLGLMPRVFYHSHLDCFDTPVSALWLLTAFLFWLSVERGGWHYPVLTGLAYGILLNTKHNSWLLPGALVAYYLLIQWRPLRRGRPRGIRGGLSALMLMVGLGPLVFYATWPWIWFDTKLRLIEYATFHLQHEYYNMEFLGYTYWKPPMPRLYAWVMTLATVPGITLILAGIGGLTGLSLSFRAAKGLGHESQRTRAALLWGIGLMACYSPWWSPQTPIFGGTKHWITAYPFLALWAGLGFRTTWRALTETVEHWAAKHVSFAHWLPLSRKLVGPTLAVCVLAGPLVMTLESHPWGLTFYTPLVRGASGAASLGLNRTFWGYTTGAVQDFVNRTMPPEGRLYLHDTAQQSYWMMLQDGRIRNDVQGTLDLASSSMGLYHHEPHMSRVEQELWVVYGTTAPAAIALYQGVPVVWVYARPPLAKE